MLISPILNSIFEGNDKKIKNRVIPLFILILGWSFLTHIPIIKEYIPNTSGVDPLSCLTMSCIYVLARIIRMKEYDRYIKGYIFWSIFSISVIFCAIGFSHYDSIFSLIVVVGIFQIFNHFKFHNYISKLSLFIAPSMFSVYIIHQTYHGFDFINTSMRLVQRMSINNQYVQTLFAAIIVFFSCVVIDLPRRIFVNILMNILSNDKNNIRVENI